MDNGADEVLESDDDCAELYEKIRIVHADMQTLRTNFDYLPKIHMAVETQNRILLDTALGRKQVPVETMHLVVKILGYVIAAELAILVFAFTGGHISLLNIFGHQ